MKNYIKHLKNIAMFIALFSFCAPSILLAQSSDPKINIDVKNASVYYTLTLLFDRAKEKSYKIPGALKDIAITAHFNDLPLETALSTVLKNTGYTYKIEDSVYVVYLKVVQESSSLPDKPVTTNNTTINGKTIYRIPSTSLIYNSTDLVTRIGGKVLKQSR